MTIPVSTSTDREIKYCPKCQKEVYTTSVRVGIEGWFEECCECGELITED